MHKAVLGLCRTGAACRPPLSGSPGSTNAGYNWSFGALSRPLWAPSACSRGLTQGLGIPHDDMADSSTSCPFPATCLAFNFATLYTNHIAIDSHSILRALQVEIYIVVMVKPTGLHPYFTHILRYILLHTLASSTLKPVFRIVEPSLRIAERGPRRVATGPTGLPFSILDHADLTCMKSEKERIILLILHEELVKGEEKIKTKTQCSILQNI